MASTVLSARGSIQGDTGGEDECGTLNGSMVEEPKWLNKLLESANNSRRGSLVTHTLDQNQNVIALKQAFARHQLAPLEKAGDGSDDRSSGEPPLDGAFRQDQELVTAPLENPCGDNSQTAGTVQPCEPFQPRDNVQRTDSDKTITPDDENIPPFPTVTTAQEAMNCGRPIKKTSHPLAVPFPPAPLTIAIPEYPKMVPQKPLPVAAYNKMTQQYPQRQPLGVNVNIHNRPPEQEMRPICKTMQHQPLGGSNKAFVHANAGLKGHLRPISGIPAFNSLGPLANPKALGPPKPAVTHPDLATLPPPEYLKNMPPPPPSLSTPQLGKGEDRGTPVYQPVQPLEGAFQNLARTWKVKRDGLVGGKRLSMIPQRVQTPPPLLPAWASKNPTRAQYMAAKQGPGGISNGPSPSLLYVAQPQPVAKPPPSRPSGPGSELHLRLEQAIQFYKMLERDRRLTETELTKVFPGKRLTGKLMPLHNQAIRMPTNPTRVDRLIWDNFREHARITDLARKMEKHSGISKQASDDGEKRPSTHIKSMTTAWMEAIQNVRQKRLEEARFMQIGKADKTSHITKEHLMALAEAIGKLSVAIKRVRTGLWCTLQFTIAAVDEAKQKDKST